MERREQNLHKICIKYFRLQYPKILAFHCPNGGYRSKIEASIFKGLGVMAGVADFLILKEKNNLAIEFKSVCGKQTDSQNKFQKKWEEWGGAYFIVRDFEEFKSIVDYYLETNKPK